MRTLILLTAIFGIQILGIQQVLAHGEDKPGPHGGFITMPGAFHVELVPLTAKTLRVYLLDINWKNPTVKNSSVNIYHGANEAKCEVASNHYLCEFPGTVSLDRGKLHVTAMKDGQKGNAVSYQLPLRFESKH